LLADFISRFGKNIGNFLCIFLIAFGQLWNSANKHLRLKVVAGGGYDSIISALAVRSKRFARPPQSISIIHFGNQREPIDNFIAAARAHTATASVNRISALSLLGAHIN
jgi:hypothetical protein